MQVGIFQAEILFQCKVLLAANEDLDAALAASTRIDQDVSSIAQRQAALPAPRSIEDMEKRRRVIQEMMRKLAESRPLRAKPMNDTWMALQQLLNAAANISRLLWSGDSEGAATQREASRAGLRASVGATDSFALKDRILRNRWEHIDEYVEEWWAASERHGFTHRNISDGAPIGNATGINRFLDFNTTTKTVTFWDYPVSVHALVSEARTLESRLEAILETRLSGPV